MPVPGSGPRAFAERGATAGSTGRRLSRLALRDPARGAQGLGRVGQDVVDLLTSMPTDSRT